MSTTHARKLIITAIDGQTGFSIADLLLSGADFAHKIRSITGLTLHPDHEHVAELKERGVHVVEHKPGKVRDMAKILKDTGADTIMLIPPTHRAKMDITTELIEAAKQAGVQNVCLLSSAGADLADPQKQPRLREFVDIEQIVMASKGEESTPTGHSPVVVRAGFYAENLLNYYKQAQEDGTLPLPIGKNHKFAPVALGDIALLCAHVLSGHGKHGFDDAHRGQLITVTGPMMAAGDELATAASKALGVEMTFEDISEREAKRVLKAQAESDDSELEYLLEYYSLVREGKTNYVSTLAFRAVTGQGVQEPEDFFKVYAESFKPKSGGGKHKQVKEEGEHKESPAKKRKTDGKK